MVMKIMIVDDERLILLGLKSCIEKITDIECRVATAMSGKQALALLEEEPADLMIADVEMLGMSGLSLIEQAQKKGLCGHFMILSGYDKFEYAQTAIRLGVKDYLLKPVDKDQLRRDICRIAKEMEKEGELELMLPWQKYFPHLVQENIPPALEKCVAYIRENYQENISLAMLGDYVGKSENYLCTLFKKEWDVTFLELVNEMRMKQALYMLLYEPALSVKDIAQKVGYQTERQLYRLIKGKLGMTPQQVRTKEWIV